MEAARNGVDSGADELVRRPVRIRPWRDRRLLSLGALCASVLVVLPVRSTLPTWATDPADPERLCPSSTSVATDADPDAAASSPASPPLRAVGRACAGRGGLQQDGPAAERTPPDEPDDMEAAVAQRHQDLTRTARQVELALAQYRQNHRFETGDGTALGSTKGLTPHTKRARDEFARVFGAIEVIGGYRASNSRDPSGHPSGKAIDIMIPSYRHNAELGDAIAAYAIRDARRLGVKYIIWQQRQWTPGRGSWVRMADRGSDTQNHVDHVHISFTS